MQGKLILSALVMCVSGCGMPIPDSLRGGGSETEREICYAWGSSLPTRSRSDTQATIDAITGNYAAFAAACPEFVEMIP